MCGQSSYLLHLLPSVDRPLSATVHNTLQIKLPFLVQQLIRLLNKKLIIIDDKTDSKLYPHSMHSVVVLQMKLSNMMLFKSENYCACV